MNVHLVENNQIHWVLHQNVLVRKLCKNCQNCSYQQSINKFHFNTIVSPLKRLNLLWIFFLIILESIKNHSWSYTCATMNLSEKHLSICKQRLPLAINVIIKLNWQSCVICVYCIPTSEAPVLHFFCRIVLILINKII